MGLKYDVFLSYSHKDEHIAVELADRICSLGLSCFMSAKDLRVGEKWDPTVRSAILASEQILLLITPRSSTSKWVLMESGAAWIEEKTLLPLIQFVDPQEVGQLAHGCQAKVIETEGQTQAFLRELAGIVSPGPPPPDITFSQLVAKINEKVTEMRAKTFYPDIIIGSGNSGAICAGIFATSMGRKALKVVNCEFKGNWDNRTARIDDSALQEKDIAGKNLLVVEWARRKGQVFSLIKAKIDSFNPAGVQYFAFYCPQELEPQPDYCVYKSKKSPVPPWVA